MNQFQERNKSTMKPHKDLTPDQSELLDWAIGLGGECGEVLDLIKHDIWHSEKADPMELAKELGDVLWYISAIATAKGMDLDDIMALNMLKLDYRYGGSFNTDGSLNRKELEVKMKESDEYKTLVARLSGTQKTPKRIIVIGPDGAGKTTFCKLLQKHTGYKYIKCSCTTKDKAGAAEELMNKEKVLLDRFYFPDESIYSEVMNQQTSPDAKARLENIAKRIKGDDETLFIYVFADLDTLIARVNRRGDEYIESGELADILSRYNRFMVDFPHDAGTYRTMYINTSEYELNNPNHVQELFNIYDMIVRTGC